MDENQSDKILAGMVTDDTLPKERRDAILYAIVRIDFGTRRLQQAEALLKKVRKKPPEEDKWPVIYWLTEITGMVDAYFAETKEKEK